MDILKSLKVMQTLDAKFHKICIDVDAFVENVLKWGDELEEIVEREFSTRSNMSTFLLPKTLSEKKLRKTKNTLVPKSSIANSTFCMNNTANLDNTMSTRTRAARSRALKTQMSQLHVTTDQNETTVEITNETIKIERNYKISSSNETFVVPNATSTRTKPVVKKVQDLEISEAENIIEEEMKISKVTNEISDGRPSRKKVSGNLSKSPGERQSRNEISRTVSETPISRQSKSLFSRTVSEGPVTRFSKSIAPEVESSSSPVEGSIRKKISRALSESPVKRPSKISKTHSSAGDESNRNRSKSPEILSKSRESRRSMFRAYRTSSQSPITRSSKIIAPESPDSSPLLRSSSLRVLRTSSKSPALKISKDNDPAMKCAEVDMPRQLEQFNSFTNKTVTIMPEETPRAVATTYVLDEKKAEEFYSETGEEKTPTRVSVAKGGRKTSTPISDRDKTLLFDEREVEAEESIEGKEDDRIAIKSEEKSNLEENCADSLSPFALSHDLSGKEESIENSVPKKKKRSRKKGKSEKSMDELANTGRITRTKSKAIKDMLKETGADEANQHNDLSEFAKKILNKAKMNSLKKNQLVAVLESNGTPKSNGCLTNLPTTGILASKSKYHLLLSSSKKLKTPLATLPNSSVKRPKPSDYKDNLKTKITKRDSSVENLVGSATKTLRGLENEVKLKTKKKKEDEVAKKRQKVIKRKQEELRRKNELKHQLATKQREKLEQEKYNNMIQSEKEKEERHKLILHERQMKMKEEAFKKKMMTQQKIAETIERRRLEEEARIAKLKEMELEEQRIALEKQREQERQEKRAQERLALKKAREEYELQLKQELEMERLKAAAAAPSAAKKFLSSASKVQSSSKKPKIWPSVGEKKDWDYKPRNENDYGLEDEHSSNESDDEKNYCSNKKTPAWSAKVMNCKCPIIKVLTIEMLCEYMPCHKKTPDVQKMFDMTPKRIKRTSSAIWNTPT